MNGKYSLLCVGLVASLAAVSSAQSFTEGFDDITTLGASGWASQNLSASASTAGPLGSHWWQGNANPEVNTSSNFDAHLGTASSFIGTDFGATTASAGNLSNWLFAPVRTLQNGDTFTFFSRSGSFGGTQYPDRMRLMLSTSGSSTAIANFSAVLTINPNLTATGYPATWTQYSYTVAGLAAPISGRFAFHYDVTDGGISGANSGRIGIDSVSYNAVPEPMTMTVLALGGLLAARRRRNAR
jgi:hypothetical protein